jgi:transcriptional regulator with XRE-family HTH domain
VEVVTEERLGVSLKRLRRAAGMTQEELAERAGISARTVSDVERGLRAVVHGDTARRLAAALGLTGETRDTFDALARGRHASEPLVPPGSGLPQPPTWRWAVAPGLVYATRRSSPRSPTSNRARRCSPGRVARQPGR